MARRRRKPLDARLPELRVSSEQLARWKRTAAHYPKLSFSEWLRGTIDGAVTIDELARRADKLADARFARLGAETPLEQRARRRRGEHDWPEVDEAELEP